MELLKKIWEQSNFPNINFYLLYGLISNTIIWIIYKIFLCLLDTQDKIKDLVFKKGYIKENDINNENDENKNNNKFNDLMKQIKIKMIIFFIVILIIILLCFIYLVSFFAIYTGTRSKVFKAYYISLIEIILIKFVYGICLASLRIASEGNELKILYKIVYICDKYIS